MFDSVSLGKRRFVRYMGVWAGLTLFLGAAARVLAAGPHVFQSGETLTAAQLNDSFADLKARIEQLEAQVRPPSAFMTWLVGSGPDLADKAVVPILFDAVEFDLGGEYDTATGAFSPKYAGTYLLNCHAWYESLGVDTVSVGIVKNNDFGGGGFFDGHDHDVDYATAVSAETTVVVHAEPGDSFRCVAYANNIERTLKSDLPRRNRFAGSRLY